MERFLRKDVFLEWRRGMGVVMGIVKKKWKCLYQMPVVGERVRIDVKQVVGVRMGDVCLVWEG